MNDMFSPRGTEASPSQKKELRGYQQNALNLLRQSFGKGNKRTVIQGATGFGKTLLSAKIIEGALTKGNSVMFTAPAISLIDQTVSAFEDEGIYDIGVMQASHPRTNSFAKVQIASVQTLARREVPEVSLVIVDEAHIRSKAVEKMMKEREDVFFVGLSATPWAKGMGNLWQDLVIPTTLQELIDDGYLSKFTAYAPSIPDLTKVKTRAGEYVEADLEEIMSEGILVGGIVETWLEKATGRPTLAFGVNCAHAHTMFEAFQSAGVAAAYVDAYTDVVERQLIERRFRAGEVQVACSVRTLTTGIDWPVSCIIDAAPTKSEMLHVQKIGRGLRVNEGTEDLMILDHAGNSLRLGLVTDILHDTLDKSIKGEKQKKTTAEKLPKECANCGGLHTGLTCPFCGHERKPIAGVETADGVLVEINGKKPPKPTMAEKQLWFSAFLFIARKRGYKDGWASQKYRQKYDVWPKGIERMPTEPTQEIYNWVKAKQIAYAKRSNA
jgi:superfamily II DNA or RNA helicase